MKNSDFIIRDGILEKYVGSGGDVVIPDGVTTIRQFAFSDCGTLQSVHISDGVTKIGGYTFDGCINLLSVHIPDSVTEIGFKAFNKCEKLTSVRIPENLNPIEAHVFSQCWNLKDIETAGTPFIISGGQLMQYVGRDRDVVVPNGVHTICRQVFKEILITSVVLPASLRSIKEEAFQETNIQNIVIPEGVTEIGYDAFRDCINLKSVSLPTSIKNIRSGAFSGCESLTEIALPFGLEQIGDLAFSGCKSLPALSIPKTVKTLAKNAFENVGSMAAKTINDCCVLDASLISYQGSAASVIVPDGVITIVKGGLAQKGSFQKVTLPASVKNIDRDAFIMVPEFNSIGGSSTNSLRKDGMPKEMNIPKEYLQQEKDAYDADMVMLLLDGPWKSLATNEDYISMFLKQSRKPLIEKCKEYLSVNIATVWEELLRVSENGPDKTNCEKIAVLAMENEKKLTPCQLHRLYVIAEEKQSKKALKLLAAYKSPLEDS